MAKVLFIKLACEEILLPHRFLFSPFLFEQKKLSSKIIFFFFQVLLKHKAQSNILNSFGETPLSISCKQGLKDVVEILLKYGADPSSVSLNGLKEDIQELLKKQKEVGVGKAANKMSALRFMPLRFNFSPFFFLFFF